MMDINPIGFILDEMQLKIDIALGRKGKFDFNRTFKW